MENPKHTKSALQWKVLVNHKVLFIFQAIEDAVYLKHKFCILAS